MARPGGQLQKHGRATAADRHPTRATLPKDARDISDRRSWLVCAQDGAPPVHLDLFLPRGHEPELLRIGRGTDVAVRVLGASGGHITGLFAGVIAGELPAGLRDGDLRRYVLLSASLQGRRLQCTLVHPVLRVIHHRKRDAAKPARKLRPTRVYCTDTLRTLAGQEFLLDFTGVDAPQRLAKGTVLEVRFTGAIDATPAAKVLRLLPN